jgi:hypothetical protein
MGELHHYLGDVEVGVELGDLASLGANGTRCREPVIWRACRWKLHRCSGHRVILFEVLSQISDKEHDDDRNTQYRAADVDG